MSKNKNLPPLECRNYTMELRAEKKEKDYIIEGRPIVYNQVTNLGWCDEEIQSGALDSADLSDVRFLTNHDSKKIPLARSRKSSLNNTMTLSVDDKGLMITVNLDVDNNADARALYSAVQRGDITGMSFMFGIDQCRWENLESDHPTRVIEKISSVVEVSAVTFPAYEQTEIYARSKELLENARKEMEIEKQKRAKSAEADGDLELEKLKTLSILNLEVN